MVKRILNARSGPLSTRRLGSLLATEGWQEVRFDIDPAVQPDVLGSITEIDQHFPIDDFGADERGPLASVVSRPVPAPPRNTAFDR